MFLKSLVTSQILQRKGIPRPRCCTEPCQMRSLCPGALCEAAQAFEEKNGHTLEWLISRIEFLFCFVPLKGTNSLSRKLELHLKISQLLPVPFPAPKGVTFTDYGPQNFLCKVEVPQIPKCWWKGLGGNVLIFCTKLSVASFRDKIHFCAEMQKAVSCTAEVAVTVSSLIHSWIQWMATAFSIFFCFLLVIWEKKIDSVRKCGKMALPARLPVRWALS